MRWTVRAASFQSVMDNYGVLQERWDEAVDVAKVRTRIIGIQTTMTRFEYLFGTVLGECILNHADNLSKSLQERARFCVKILSR